MDKPKVEINIKSWTWGMGPYHPAIYDITTYSLWYWPNITYETEEEAQLRASLSVIGVLECGSIADMNALINSWNIYKAR